MLAIAAYVVEVPISSAAIEAEPALADYRTFDLKVRVWPRDAYQVSDLVANLSSGDFYNATPPAGVENGGLVAHPQLWNDRPELQFDTWVAAPLFNYTGVPGRGDDQPGPPVFSETAVSVTWGELVEFSQHSGTGDFTIARLTTSDGAEGTLRGRIGHRLMNGDQFYAYSFDIGESVPPPAQPPPAPPPAPPPPPPPPPPPGPPPGPGDPPPPPPTGRGTITGRVFADLNSSGRHDNNEVLLSGRLVWVDSNMNGRRDAGERYTRTGLSGRFTITDVPMGANLVRISMPAGWHRTNPSRGAHNVILSRDKQVQNRNFGMTDRIIVRGSVFEDRNRNGVFDTNLDRTPSARFWIFADSDGDGRFDAGESLVRADARGQWRMELSRPGTYQIRIVMRSGWMPTNAAVRTLSVSAGAAPAPIEFGIRRVI